MAGQYSSPQIDSKAFSYENFMGLETSRDHTSLDTGKDQHLVEITNAFCDWRGQIVRDPAMRHFHGTSSVSHIVFYSSNEVVWAESDVKGDVYLQTAKGHRSEIPYNKNTTLSSTVFNNKAVFASDQRNLMLYDGGSYTESESAAAKDLGAKYCVAIQNRLVIAGIRGKETEIHFSRINNENIFPDDEAVDEVSVSKAATLDLINVLGEASKVSGLGVFESNKLVMFTPDRAILYVISHDYRNWHIVTDANINIGCLSHNTIATAGTDLLFCSRSGVHSIRKSKQNGIMVFSHSLSDKIDLLYRSLVRSVADPDSISAVFDQDEAQYHIYFPQSGGVLCKRLTLSLNPELEDETPKFSEGDTLNTRCGAFSAGKMLTGSAAGVYEVIPSGNPTDVDDVTPSARITTPFLWHGNLSATKSTYSLTLQATGKGVLNISAVDDANRIMGSITVEVDDEDDGKYTGVPLFRQYERSWQHHYRAAQYTITIQEGSGLLRIIGFAVTVRK